MSDQTISNIVPTTELEAINAMLAINGESPRENLTDPVPAHVEVALNIIRRISRGIQSKGWHFNTVFNTTLTRDSGAGFSIATPSNALRVRKTVNDDQRDFDFSHRGGFLWDNLTNSDSFDGDDYVNGVQVDITYALDFTELPEPARQLIVIMAGRKYQEQTLGNADLSGFSSEDQAFALANLIESEGLIDETNILLNFKDQRRAKSVFDSVSKQVQGEGWHFNTRKDVGIEPDGDGHIVLPDGTLRVSKSATRASQWELNVAHRGQYMYDVVNNTYVFDAADLENGTLYLDIIEFLDRSELPDVALRYIEIKASRQLQPQNRTGNPEQGFTERDEFLARQALIDDQGLIEDDNLLDSPTVSRTLYGRTSPYGSGGGSPFTS